MGGHNDPFSDGSGGLGDRGRGAVVRPDDAGMREGIMSVPFTQYLRPNGRKREISIDLPEEVEALARRFIEGGGWFEVEELTTGHVSLTACAIVDNEPQDIAIRVVPNGPGVAEAVEAIIREVT